MGVNLGSVCDTTVGDPEGVNSPIQVESLLRLPKGQPLSQSSLVNLDNIDTSFLKILHFVLDGQSYLIASLMSGNRKIHHVKELQSRKDQPVEIDFSFFLFSFAILGHKDFYT